MKKKGVVIQLMRAGGILRNRIYSLLYLLICALFFVNVILPTEQALAAVTQFKQGLGYQPGAYDRNIRILIDNVEQTYSQQPIMINDIVMVPLRGIFESLGATIKWDDQTNTVTATKGDITIVLKIGDTEATRNGVLIQLSQPGQIINDKTMVPVRFVSEVFGVDVKWDSETKTVNITTLESDKPDESMSLSGKGEKTSESANLWEKSTCSIDELYKYLKNVDKDAAEAFLENRTWPENIQIPKNSDVLNADGTINWGKAPKGGYVIDKTTGEAIKDIYTPKIGEVIDRYGPSNGRYTSPVIDGKPYNYDQRALPYVEDTAQYHQYEVTGDISKLKEYVANCKDATLKSQIEDDIDYYYNGDYSKVVTYKGDIAGIDGWGSGGGIQYEFPVKVEYLEKLGILKEIN